MNIIRYLRYSQSDLSAALERITGMRAEKGCQADAAQKS